MAVFEPDGFYNRQYDPQLDWFMGIVPMADAEGQQIFSP